MSSKLNFPGLLAWERLQLGWLDLSQIACIATPEQKDVVLEPLEEPAGAKAAIVQTSPTTFVVAEVREPKAEDSRVCDSGVLIYTVDARVEDGMGALRVQPAVPDDGSQAVINCSLYYRAAYRPDRVSTFVTADGHVRFRGSRSVAHWVPSPGHLQRASLRGCASTAPSETQVPRPERRGKAAYDCKEADHAGALPRRRGDPQALGEVKGQPGATRVSNRGQAAEIPRSRTTPGRAASRLDSGCPTASSPEWRRSRPTERGAADDRFLTREKPSPRPAPLHATANAQIAGRGQCFLSALSETRPSNAAGGSIRSLRPSHSSSRATAMGREDARPPDVSWSASRLIPGQT